MTMKNRISTKFPGQDFLSCSTAEIYIMDYTNQTKNVRGIEWSNVAPADIEAFFINNLPLLDITFCVFKENKIKLAGEKEELPHCEGILFPANNSGKIWITFLELKYPQKRSNLGSELKQARKQLLFTLDLFRKQGVIEEKQLVYLIFSAPKYNQKTKYGIPFESWSMEPKELKEIRKTKYAIMRGINSFHVISNDKIKL